MPKYRCLSEQELKTFEKVFIEFLIINGITAQEWEEMKQNQAGKAERIIDLFSDVILEGILRQINFMEIRTDNYIAAIQCLQDKMILIGVSSDRYDLSKIGKETEVVPKEITLHRSEKKYKDNRESELFELTKKGFDISDGKLFKLLMLASVE